LANTTGIVIFTLPLYAFIQHWDTPYLSLGKDREWTGRLHCRHTQLLEDPGPHFTHSSSQFRLEFVSGEAKTSGMAFVIMIGRDPFTSIVDLVNHQIEVLILEILIEILAANIGFPEKWK
jgi:hypothetical protein